MTRDDGKILRKYNSIRKLSKRVFGGQLGEDVAQEAALKLLEGGDLKQRNYYAIVDAARRRGVRAYGRGGGIVEPSRPGFDAPDTNSFSRGARSPSEESERGCEQSVFMFVRLVSMLKNPELIQILILHESYELTLLEISHFFGVSESRISQRLTLSKKLLKKIAYKEGLSQSYQRNSEQKSSGILSHQIKIVPAISGETKVGVEEIREEEIVRKSELAKRAFFKIPKAVFLFTRKNQKEYQTKMPRVAKIKLEGKSFICPRMEKKTINLWPQKSNC